jgi:hypothetical protein
MRRFRMTTRRWMVAVAVVGPLLGVVIGGLRLKQRRDYYLQQANNAARWENYMRSMASRVASRPPLQRPSVTSVGQSYTVAEVAAEYAKQKEVFLHAASRPWISIPPDRFRRSFLIRDVLPDPPLVVIENSERPEPESGESPTP